MTWNTNSGYVLMKTRIYGMVRKNCNNEDVVTMLFKYNYENEEDHKSKKRQVLHLCSSPTYCTNG